jgi:FMN phosphatase YigB (HAD superfamily)
MIRAHSFDVFDTVLVRTRARPVDLFRAAAERAVPGPPERPGRAELVAELSRRRRAAEFQAMARLGLDAVGLDAIYAELDDLGALGVQPAELMRAELEVEVEEVRPVRAGRERVQAARATGRRVLFVSDMYLPAERIRAALDRFDIAQPDDPLYVSGELGVDKRRGGLFDHVLRTEGLKPDELAHTGDDPVTDIEVPEGRGIAVEPLSTARLNRFEWEVLSKLPVPREVAARVVGASRAARVAHAAEGGDAAHAAAAGANVGGPLFASFVAWVLRSARKEGVDRLYFVSRDSQVLLRAALAIARDGDPECRYLYGSRQAWLLPGVDRVDRDSLHWILEPELAPPRALLAKLEVDAEEVVGELRAHGLGPDDRLARDESLERFWAVVFEIEPLILERAARVRSLASAYFEQEGLYASGRWALVDLGWRLTAQRALRTVLSHGGDPVGVLGFYLGVNRKRTRPAEAGSFRAFLFEDDEPDALDLPEAWVWGHISLVEQLLAMADHGSCAGYRREDGRVAPVLRALDPDPRRAALCDCIQATVVECARELDRAGLLAEHLADVRAAALLMGRLMVERPERDEAAALGWVPVTDDQNETRSRALAPPLTLTDVWRRTRERLGRPVVRDFDTLSQWPQGSLALASPAMRTLYHSLRVGRRLAKRARQTSSTASSVG